MTSWLCGPTPRSAVRPDSTADSLGAVGVRGGGSGRPTEAPARALGVSRRAVQGPLDPHVGPDSPLRPGVGLSLITPRDLARFWANVDRAGGVPVTRRT